MKIRIDGYESPHVLKALAALLINLANEPRVDKGCVESSDKPGPFPDASRGEVVTATPEPLPGRATAYKPFDIFPADVMGGNHEDRFPRVETVVAVAPRPPVQGFDAERDLLRIVASADPQGGAPVPATLELRGQGALIVPPPPPVSATDKTGTPWDARIHSSSRALVANGTWRLKKGVDKTLVESVTRELREPERPAVLSARANIAALVSPPPVFVPQPPGFPLAPQSVTGAMGLGSPVAGPPNVLTTALAHAPAPPSPATNAPPPLPFNEISRFFAVHCMAGKLTHADMEAMAKHSGVEYTQDLMTAANADKRPSALAYLQSLVDSRA